MKYCSLLLLVCTLLAWARPAPPSYPLPGTSRGKVSSRWVAPFVSARTQQVGGRSSTLITWFGEDGNILQEETGDLQPGFAHRVEKGNHLIFGLNARWKLALPPNPGNNNYITGTPDSRVFLHQVSVGEREVSLHIYINGYLATKTAPLPIGGGFAEVSDAGCVAMLTRASLEKMADTQVVVFGPDGKQRFRVKIDTEVHNPTPAPDGNGVVVQDNSDVDDGNRFYWYTAQGNQRTLVIGYNGYLQTWAPNSHVALFSTSEGDDYQYKLVDMDTGKTRWSIPPPNKSKVDDVVLTSDLMLFAVAERYNGDSWGGDSSLPRQNGYEYIRAFYAADLNSGQLLAVWRARYPTRYCLHQSGLFRQLGNRLFFVTPEEFVELNTADIREKKNGWTAVK